MGLRPAHTCRDLNKTPWSRFSKKKPKKSFVKSMPHATLHVYNMGTVKADYDTLVEVSAAADIQIRDNSLESGRQAINRHLEKALTVGGFQMKLLVYPHNVIRENKMITGAGADRLQKGMRKSFGRATSRAARIRQGQIVFTVRCRKANIPVIKEGVKRAQLKMPGKFVIEVKSLAPKAS
ncbi:50S ribosomal protein L10e [Candidatus Gugararchaeum adminiculabundum]|nr:50S ribosomal protein L10e [Candidatus Gugararchaeum adminiculabundum]